mmetsp:Transcript_2457/g.4013  ORF Transcript_2457/g.4013 Transcript_2457/m.4013 type:complete len:91 (-) Transcript_2457:34-306(-)
MYCTALYCTLCIFLCLPSFTVVVITIQCLLFFHTLPEKLQTVYHAPLCIIIIISAMLQRRKTKKRHEMKLLLLHFHCIDKQELCIERQIS